jgi:hypothetical protein
MSRYSFAAEDGNSWTLGWDGPTATYFADREPLEPHPYDARIHGPSEDAYEDSLYVQVAGGDVGELPTLADLQARLPAELAVPPTILERLAADGPTDPGAHAARARERIAGMERLLTGASSAPAAQATTGAARATAAQYASNRAHPRPTTKATSALSAARPLRTARVKDASQER